MNLRLVLMSTLLLGLDAPLADARFRTFGSIQKFGAYRSSQTVCFATSVSSNRDNILPAIRAVSFTPTAAQMTVSYIEVSTIGHSPIMATVVSGGVGSSNPTQTSILVNVQNGGSFQAVVKIYCDT
uniref:Uncharacterized protein n=1 Tax=Anopheles epiroticus TaxID=199890 RepID=A0A182PHR0_9DIPT